MQAPERVDAKHAEAALRVLDRNADEPRQDPAAYFVRVIAGRWHLLRVESPLAEDHVGVRANRPVHQRRGLFGKMLHVSIEEQHVRELALEHPREARADGLSFAKVGAVDDDLGAGGPGAFRRLIRRPIVHHDDVIDGAAQAVHHSRDGAGLVQRGNDGRGSWRHRVGASAAAGSPPPACPLRSSAGRTSTEAAARATVLAADTMPIDRKGG